VAAGGAQALGYHPEGNRKLMRKTYVLPGLLVILLGSIYVLPQRGSVAESSVRMDLPLRLAGWSGMKRQATSEEIRILAEDTEFEKADYVKFKRGMTGILSEKQDVINATIVLSGVDINNSIHRPERCLPSQGHFGMAGSNPTLKLPSGREIGFRRLKTKQKIRLSETDEVVLDSLVYYFFVGHKQMTHDHLARTFMDMRDRLFHGSDQRWAYITVSLRYGDVPGLNLETSEEEGDVLLREFFSKLIPEIVDLPAIRP
jgi:hypothetical protein